MNFVGPVFKAFINNLQLRNKRHPLIKSIQGYKVNRNINPLMVLFVGGSGGGGYPFQIGIVRNAIFSTRHEICLAKNQPRTRVKRQVFSVLETLFSRSS